MSERWERRERKLQARRRRMPVHGKGMAEIYRHALLKRMKELSERLRKLGPRARRKGRL